METTEKTPPRVGYMATEANGKMYVMKPSGQTGAICTTAKFAVVTKPEKLREEAHQIANALNGAEKLNAFTAKYGTRTASLILRKAAEQLGDGALSDDLLDLAKELEEALNAFRGLAPV